VYEICQALQNAFSDALLNTTNIVWELDGDTEDQKSANFLESKPWNPDSLAKPTSIKQKPGYPHAIYIYRSAEFIALYNKTTYKNSCALYINANYLATVSNKVW